jgi:hypothetical protein
LPSSSNSMVLDGVVPIGGFGRHMSLMPTRTQWCRAGARKPVAARDPDTGSQTPARGRT